MIESHASSDFESTARSRFLIVTIALPLVATGIAFAIQRSVLDDVPDTIFGFWLLGAPASPTTSLAWSTAIGLLIPFTIAGLGLSGFRAHERTESYRPLGAIAAWNTTFLAALSTLTILSQRGLTEASEGPSLFIAHVGATAIGLTAAAIGWFIQPAPVRDKSVGDHQPLPVATSTGATWEGTASTNRWATIVIWAATAMLWSMAIGRLLLAERTVVTAVFGILVPVISLANVAISTFRVRIDQRGLVAASFIGLPRFRVPLNDVVVATVRTVKPLREFGGFGPRSGSQGFGLILRSGNVLDVLRSDGKHFVITVDDPATAAAALNAAATAARTN